MTDNASPPPITSRPRRSVYALLGGHALWYADVCLNSLLDNALEPLDFVIITDGLSDREQIRAAIKPHAAHHTVAIYTKDDADARAAEIFKNFPRVQAFRNGHPCWRKCTDPQLFAAPDQELIILDPDVYFPNKFTFEPTPATGLLLMRQIPNCLFPKESVEAAFDARIPMADKTDIGVAQLRNGIDPAWFEAFCGKLEDRNALDPRYMHIESIVWAAWAMHAGSGYLDTTAWKCWHRAHWKRIAMIAKMKGEKILEHETYRRYKCFHATGDAKRWLKPAIANGAFGTPATLDQPTPITPFFEYPRRKFDREQSLKSFLWKVGYYPLINGVKKKR
jgi:hypothetical protein